MDGQIFPNFGKIFDIRKLKTVKIINSQNELVPYQELLNYMRSVME